MKTLTFAACVCFAIAPFARGAEPAEKDSRPMNDHYVSNRAPLAPSQYIKLPVGSIQPEGWLLEKLELQADGFHGHLGDISRFLKKEGGSWLDPEGFGDHGWEEPPYWLKGYLNCAYILGDEEMIKESQVWIEGALRSQKEDGWFGPDGDRAGAATRLKGRADLWPNMIMLFCLQDYYSATGDERVIKLMTRYFEYLMERPEEDYLLGYWPKMRGGDLLYSIFWLYNITGDHRLLKLAEKNHRCTARWDEDVINWHNVNIGQAFGEGTTYSLLSGEEADHEAAYRNWDKILTMYGQMPGGMFASDENARPGYTDPRQCVETCGMIEAMLSDETLVAITGDLLWADRCEDIAYNSLPAALTADMKALRYLTAPNQVVSDAKNHSPGIQNGGAMFHMNPHAHRCCQHNFGHGWPYFAQHLWYATPDNGLAAILYSECSVEATVVGDVEVTISQETQYPFDKTVTFKVEPDRPVTFPLYLRIPGWCDSPSITVNGEPYSNAVTEKNASRVKLYRVWKRGDTVVLTLPAKVTVRNWTENKNSISIDRGPLTYSLRIEEEYVREGGTDEWPAWEIHPTSPWNYAIDTQDADWDAFASGLTVTKKAWPENDMPWTLEGVPLELTAKARRLPQWVIDKHGLCSFLQQSPVKTSEPLETIRLVPMGAARLRISSFPVVGQGPDATQWELPPQPKRLYKAGASNCFDGDTLGAFGDDLDPANSNDHSIPRHTFWPNKGTTEWLSAQFDKPAEYKSVRIYWFDDTGRGFCRVPKSWSLLYRDGEGWKPVTTDDTPGCERDKFNEITFEPVTTDAFKMVIELQAGLSGGALEWRIE